MYEVKVVELVYGLFSNTIGNQSDNNQGDGIHGKPVNSRGILGRDFLYCGVQFTNCLLIQSTPLL